MGEPSARDWLRGDPQLWREHSGFAVRTTLALELTEITPRELSPFLRSPHSSCPPEGSCILQFCRWANQRRYVQWRPAFRGRTLRATPTVTGSLIRYERTEFASSHPRTA